MPTLISYDVSARQPDMKKDLEALGYKDTLTGKSGTVYNLPNTTLSSLKADCGQAKLDMEKTAAKLNITLQRAIAVEFQSFAAIIGEDHA